MATAAAVKMIQEEITAKSVSTNVATFTLTCLNRGASLTYQTLLM
jgi:hypothetical protein